MKKLLLFLSFFIVSTLLGQNYICQVKKAGADKWSYINQDGVDAFRGTYTKCYEFSSNGLAAVFNEANRQYVFINTRGQVIQTEVTTFKMKGSGFSDGMVAIRVNGQWGFMNTQGKLAIQPKYEDVTAWYEGHATAELGTKRIILSADGSEIVISDANVEAIKHFSEELAPFYTADKRLGFMGVNGQVVIPPKFQSVGYFSGGLAWAKMPDGKVGYIDKKGEWVIEPQFDIAKNFDPVARMALVKKDDQWCYVSDSGKLLKKILDSYGNFSEGLCYGKVDGLVGFFDSTGTWVINHKFQAVRDFKNGFAAAKSEGRWGMINKEGNWVTQPRFDKIKDMELIKENL